jgi:galactose mutarotase-like enzyme
MAMVAEPEAAPIVLESARVTAIVTPTDGGRLSSFRIDGRELLVTSGTDPLDHGCFPMAPFAGRVRDARFRFRGREWHIRRSGAPHAIHGTVARRAWERIGPTTIRTDLGPDWPFRGEVIQQFELTDDRLRIRMYLRAAEPMPATIGWHPWFRWSLDGGRVPSIARAIVHPNAALMYTRDADGLPIGRLAAPDDGPWDDCFTGLSQPTEVHWDDGLVLSISSSCPDVVVFTESDRGLCVEPQTGPPDALNLRPRIVRPGTPLTAEMTWAWSDW